MRQRCRISRAISIQQDIVFSHAVLDKYNFGFLLAGGDEEAPGGRRGRTFELSMGKSQLAEEHTARYSRVQVSLNRKRVCGSGVLQGLTCTVFAVTFVTCLLFWHTIQVPSCRLLPHQLSLHNIGVFYDVKPWPDHSSEMVKESVKVAGNQCWTAWTHEIDK